MIVLACGSRDWTSVETISAAFDRAREPITLLVHGDCRGADRIAAAEAERRGIPTKAYPARWDLYGRGAGPLRNAKMLDENNVDEVWAFTDDLEASRGTKNLVSMARVRKVRVVVCGSKESKQ